MMPNRGQRMPKLEVTLIQDMTITSSPSCVGAKGEEYQPREAMAHTKDDRGKEMCT